MSHLVETIPQVRSDGTVSSVLVGVGFAAFQVQPSLAGGFVCAPFRTPLDMNRAYPASLYVAISPATAGAVPATFVEYNLLYTLQAPGYARSDVTIVQLFPAPNPWPTTDLAKLLLDNGNGRTFEPNTLDPQTIIGLKIRRNGAGVNDTFPNAVNMLTALYFEYLPIYPWQYF